MAEGCSVTLPFTQSQRDSLASSSKTRFGTRFLDVLMHTCCKGNPFQIFLLTLSFYLSPSEIRLIKCPKSVFHIEMIAEERKRKSKELPKPWPQCLGVRCPLPSSDRLPPAEMEAVRRPTADFMQRELRLAASIWSLPSEIRNPLEERRKESRCRRG